MRPCPTRSEVGDDRWVPLAGPTGQRVKVGCRRRAGWATGLGSACWPAAVRDGSRPMPAAARERGDAGSGWAKSGREKIEKEISFLFAKQKF